jgi:hypothetical protein
VSVLNIHGAPSWCMNSRVGCMNGASISVLPTTSYSNSEPGADKASIRVNSVSTSDASMYCSSPSISHTVLVDGENPCKHSTFGQSAARSTPTATRRHRGCSPAKSSSLAAITCGWSTS